MADLGEDFDQDTVEPSDSLEPVPNDVYALEIIESDVVETKSGTGRMIKLTINITEGPYEGRRIWDNINFRNQNEVAQRIGQQSLASLCAACGHRGPLRDTELLHKIPFKGRVVIEHDKTGQYGPRNAIKSYMPYNNADAAPHPAPSSRATQTPAQRQTAAPTARANAAGTRPWGNASR